VGVYASDPRSMGRAFHLYLFTTDICSENCLPQMVDPNEWKREMVRAPVTYRLSAMSSQWRSEINKECREAYHMRNFLIDVLARGECISEMHIQNSYLIFNYCKYVLELTKMVYIMIKHYYYLTESSSYCTISCATRSNARV
jgi:hypothetical protein